MAEWTKGLKRQGMYYEGWVTCADSVLALHIRETVTCYGTRRSSKIIGSTATVEDKENTSAKGNKVRIIITSIH